MMPTSMKGEGYYKSHSHIQKIVIDSTIPLVVAAAERVPLPENGRPFTIIDYGCGEGQNSILPVKAVIEAIRARRLKQDFVVVHDDLPTNNFKGLFQDIFGGCQDSYLSQPDGDAESKIFVFAAGTSFYRMVAPPGSVHFGFSSSALHWLSRLPEGSVRDHIFHWRATQAEKEKMSELAGCDWLALLKWRAAELTSGGRLVVTMAGSLTEADRKRLNLSGKNQSASAQKAGDLLNDVVLAMVEEGIIPRHKFEQFAIPIYMRTLDELLAPIRDRHSPLYGVLAEEHASVCWIDCPYTAAWQRDGDLESFAAELVATVRAFTEPMILKGLFGASDEPGLDPRIGLAVEEIYARMRRRIVDRPDLYSFDAVQLMAVFAKT